MRFTYRALSIVLLSAIAFGTVRSQSYPTKTVLMITAEAKGSADVATRFIAQGLSGELRQPVDVRNQGSAGGLTAAQTVARSRPDGYTLLVYGSAIWLLPYLRNDVTYDPVMDFSPITYAANAPTVLAVHPAVAANSIRELISLAKARPGELKYSAGGTAGTPHLAAELFKAMAGVDIMRVAYKGNGPALNAVVSGEAQLTFAGSSAVAPHVKAGRLRSLAVTSAGPSELAPGLPTVAASGLPGYESVNMLAVLAPGRTSSAIIDRLNGAIVKVLNTPQMKQKLLDAGIEVVGSSPDQLAATVKSDMIKMGKVIRDAGIHAD